MILPKLKEGTEQVIQRFLAEKLRKIEAKGFVLGLSGGIDSAVVTKLCANAVGKQKVLAVVMPEKDSPPSDLRDAKEFAKSEGIPFKIIDITGCVEAYKKAIGARIDKISRANIKARCRMIVLYHFANSEHRLVAGTGNKSELLIGYFTKFGDGAADIEPIGDLYKTEVRELAKQLGIPDRIIRKVPTAGLWKGQTDEGDIGISYPRLDAILLGIELGLDPKQIAERGETTLKEVDRISRMVRLSSHKRKFPAAAKIGFRTPGLDWREGDEDI
ncbi:MAG TPA: NAD+ synthase [Thermoplasmata archaeon]|nr:NAD+ synthase [Thermoplasmata archaeon]